MEKDKNFWVIMNQLIELTHLGFSLICPFIVFLWLASWLQGKYELGAWVMLLAFFLGLGNMVSVFYQYHKRYTKKDKKDPPVSFNQHK